MTDAGPIEAPDFLIVGTMKSGTSSLRHYLSQHPQIAIPAREIHFFDRDDTYARGPAWYLGRLARDRTANTTIVGEKTPTYSYDPKVPARIHRDFPGVKLVWIFRNPVDRTIRTICTQSATASTCCRFRTRSRVSQRESGKTRSSAMSNVAGIACRWSASFACLTGAPCIL